MFCSMSTQLEYHSLMVHVSVLLMRARYSRVDVLNFYFAMGHQKMQIMAIHVGIVHIFRNNNHARVSCSLFEKVMFLVINPFSAKGTL